MKKERDYSTGKIYKIWSHCSDEIYIGSTIQALSERLRGHKRSFNHYKKTGKKKIIDIGREVMAKTAS